jgi:calcium permeable stress-gated cation channel
MSLLPIVLRLLARFEGIPKKTGLELSLMTRYFIFQVIHSFLIVTLSSGIIAALPALAKNPSSVATLLAQNLPQASNFFLSYVILQGLSGTGAGFLQIVALVIYYIKLFLLGSTPRSIYDIKFSMRSVAWGTLFPSTTLLVVIGMFFCLLRHHLIHNHGKRLALAYSVISPIINGFACATFFLFYMCWKYLFLWQLDQPASGETGGLFFPKAIQHIFVGLYVQQICLAALFFLARDQKKSASAIPEGALMIVLIVFTVRPSL